MKNMITRTVVTYRVTFGKFDVKTMSATDLSVREYIDKPSKRKLHRDAPTGSTVLSVEEVEGTYYLPTSDFIRYAREYAAEEE